MTKQTQKSKNPRGGARGRLRLHFLDNVGRVMDTDELREVAGNISEWARRVREFRSDLRPGQYLLENAKPEPAFERDVSKETRAFVLDRNGNTCQLCGAVAGEIHPYDLTRKTRLHIGHVVDKSKGGSDDATNLRATCSVCNEGMQNITPIRPDLKQLLIQLRRATALDQIEALKWLVEKFPRQTEDSLRLKAKVADS
jgi:5-methylcytosine-specific restriction endonuclease McrA